ncbi:D-alanyl-D-alanine carboxypeptidase/D-alanyl-D-alanine-endopeptidase [Nocardioides sp. CN2-186]|uniref:D-alanyl-D-alanine carboxypeptidase/D-alanyl-D-alanine endopeptidase n=1 Tax=Nocardioides tweenelious TaxID=3156607 RepID=UPI0032B42E29
MVLVLGLLAAAGIAYVEVDRAAPSDDPAAIPPPAGLTLPALTTPSPVATGATGSADPGAVRRAVEQVLDDADLGPHVLATIAGLDGSQLYSAGSGTAMPASTLKLLTTTAALDTLGPDHTFDTTVVTDGPRRVVLVGGGDPLLSPQDLKKLARATAAKVTGTVKVSYDISLFSGPAINPHWPATYVPEGVVSPIQALWVDEGRAATGFGRVDDPAAAAAQVFADDLVRAGLTVRGTPDERTVADGTEVARISSRPLSQIVEHTLTTSDNEAAEVLSHQVGLAVSGVGSFAAGAKAVVQSVDDLGVPTSGAKVYDGSGLSRDDLVGSDTLASVLEVAASADHPELRSVVTGLPVAGFTGSLVDRFGQGDLAGRGVVRAKTGTLTGTSGLAGIVTDRDGTPIVFALIADRVDVLDTLDAREALDEVATALAACRCGS